MSKLTFLTQEQCLGDEELDILKIRGKKAAITDFAIALGGYYMDDYRIDSDVSLNGRTGCYWTKSDYNKDEVFLVHLKGKISREQFNVDDVGARPICAFSSINTIPTNGESGKLETDEDDVKFVYDGYYPQTAPEKDIQLELNRLYEIAEWNKKNRIPEACEIPVSIDYTGKTIKYKRIDGYRHNGKIYVRMNLKKKSAQLSNEEWYVRGDPVWFEVEPIKRLISEQGKITITEKIIFAGVPFDFKRNYNTENFDKTVIYKFTNDIWARDVERLKSIVREKDHSAGLETSEDQIRNT